MESECIEYQPMIVKSLLGDLPVDEQRMLDTHLAGCPQCRSEKETYSRTLNLMQSVGDEPVPRHFFVQPKERELNPWEIFRMLKPGWQAITAGLAGLFLLAGLCGILGFARGSVDVAALKKDFLMAAEEQNHRMAENFLQEARAEIDHSRTDLTQQQRIELAAAVDYIDSRLKERLKLTETQMREESQKMAVDVYRTVAQQRAQDLNLINLRFDGIETKNALDTHQTDTILGTLLQVAEFKLE